MQEKKRLKRGIVLDDFSHLVKSQKNLENYMKKIFIFLSFICLSLLPNFSKAAPLSTQALLQKLIQFDTSNPPGNELKLAQWIQQYLAQFDIPSEIIESEPGRGNLIARLPGKNSEESLALLGHLDVVPADPKEWSVDPFAGKIEGQILYGRGSLDMKSLVVFEIASFIKLKQEKVPLKGDVILILVADEEAGGAKGAQFLTEKYWDKVRAKYVFNEGSVGLRKAPRNLYPVQVAEKGVAWMKLTARGPSGHGSVPRADNAVLRLIRGLNLLTQKPQPIFRTTIVEEFLRRASEGSSGFTAFLMRHFFTWPIRDIATREVGDALRGDKHLNAMIRNTLTPTMLQAGYKVNVIPSEATAFVDARILPGFTPEGFREWVENQVKSLNIHAELITQSTPNESNFHTPFFNAIEKAIHQEDPSAIVAPYISAGATDSRFFRAKGAIAYGIIPFTLTPEELETFHGKDERVRLEELARGEKIFWNLLLEMQRE